MLFSKTINLCRQLEKCGVTFITVHGRTPSQKIGQPSDNDLLREVKQSISIPLIANGDCKSLQDADEMFNTIECDGIMSARGILANPTLFTGKYRNTPIECVQEWLNLGTAAGNQIQFSFFHHHFTFMMEKLLPRKHKAMFNSFKRTQQVFDYLANEFDIRPQPIHVPDNIVCTYDETNYRERIKILKIENAIKNNQYSSDTSLGKFFLEKASETSNAKSDDDSDYCDESTYGFMQTNLFKE